MQLRSIIIIIIIISIIIISIIIIIILFSVKWVIRQNKGFSHFKMNF